MSNDMRYCPAFSGIALSEKNEDEIKMLSRLRCKSWACPYCARGNRTRWRAFLLDVLPSVSEVWSFHTITCPDWIHKAKSYDESDRTLASLQHIQKNWDKFSKQMKRQLGAYEYLRVFEKHESGVLHIHLLVSHWIPEKEIKTANKGKENEYKYWRWLKDTLPAYGFGKMTSSENIDQTTSAAGYVTKYMTKEEDYLVKMISKYRVRRLQTSRGIGSQEAWGKSDLFWEVRTFIDRTHGTVLDINMNKEITITDDSLYPSPDDYRKSHEEGLRRKGNLT